MPTLLLFWGRGAGAPPPGGEAPNNVGLIMPAILGKIMIKWVVTLNPITVARSLPSGCSALIPRPNNN